MASLGQPAAWAALAGHVGRVFDSVVDRALDGLILAHRLAQLLCRPGDVAHRVVHDDLVGVRLLQHIGLDQRRAPDDAPPYLAELRRTPG